MLASNLVFCLKWVTIPTTTNDFKPTSRPRTTTRNGNARTSCKKHRSLLSHQSSQRKNRRRGQKRLNSSLNKYKARTPTKDGLHGEATVINQFKNSWFIQGLHHHWVQIISFKKATKWSDNWLNFYDGVCVFWTVTHPIETPNWEQIAVQNCLEPIALFATRGQQQSWKRFTEYLAAWCYDCWIEGFVWYIKVIAICEWQTNSQCITAYT